MHLRSSNPAVIWITGLPGSGKTTLAIELQNHLGRKELRAIHLDGDQLRAAMSYQDALDMKSRLALAQTYQKLTEILNKQGFTVIVSTVSLFSEIFESNRVIFNNYFEILLDVNFAILESGPRSAQYKQKKDVYNHQIVPEFPKNPNLTLKADIIEDRYNWLKSAISEIEIALDLNVK